MSRKKKNELYQALEVKDFASEGKAIARHNDKVIFIDYAAPGDVVDVRIISDKRRYMLGKIERLVRASEERVEPVCKHFGYCGGCKWQHLAYEKQIAYKQREVTENLHRLGKVELPEAEPILGCDDIYAYRNKLEYGASYMRWLTLEELHAQEERRVEPGIGFHIPRQFDKILHIEQCHLMPDDVNEIRLAFYQFAISNGYSFYDVREHKGFIRQIAFRANLKGEWMVTLMFGEQNEEAMEACLSMIKERFPQVVSLQYMVNLKWNDSIYDQDILLYHGDAFLTETIGDLRFKLGPKSFFQTNSKQTLRLYEQALEYAGLRGNELVYDLYCGIGTISLFLAAKAREVVGIEYIEAAVEDARLNAKENNVENARFFAGDMKDVLTDEFFEREGRPEVIITDPPRAGMHPDVVERLALSGAEKIVYVSCNPATQARDLQVLDSHYYVARYRPVDMFPHTAHTENVLLLRKRDIPKPRRPMNSDEIEVESNDQE